MANNDVVLLEKVLEAKRELAPEKLKDHEYFELFAAEQVLRDYDLSTDELLDGIVGGGDDGGLDGVYTFADTKLVEEESDFSSARDCRRPIPVRYRSFRQKWRRG